MQESQTGSMDFFWTIMCGNSGDSNGFEITYSSVLLAFIDPTSCINHMLVTSIDVLLLLSLFIFIRKRRPSTSIDISALQAWSGGYNSTLGLAYLCAGIWILGEELIDYQTVLPLHGWLVMISQGLTWLLLGSVLNLKRPFIVSNAIALNFLTIVSSFLAVVLSALALREAIVNQELTSAKIILDILLFPGGIFQLVSQFWGSRSNHEVSGARHGFRGADDDSFYTPLRDERVNEDNNTTPFSEAGFLNRMTFWWLNPLMKKGKAKVLEDDDIPCLRKEDQTRTCYSEFREQLTMRKANKPSESNCILPTILSWQWKAIAISGLFALIKVLTLATGPLFLKAFISIAEEKNNGYEYQGCALATLLFLTKCLESFSERQWYFRTRLIGLQVRSMLSTAIYQKQLRLSSAAKSAHSPGQIVNYVAVDAYRIGEFPFWLHQIWTVGLQTCLGLMIIYYCVGLATVASIIVIAVSAVVNSPLGKIQQKYQTKLMAEQDRRVRGIIEALMNIKVLKLYAWETHFKNAVDKLRETEFKWLSIVQLQKAYYIILFWSFPTVISVATFSACYLLGIGLNASNVFTFLATLRIIQDPVRSIPDVVGAYVEASVSLDRVVKFLDAPELDYQQSETRKIEQGQGQSIVIRSTGISWDSHSLKPTLRDVELVVKPGEKMAICGEVGAGKSTLLAAILGEVPHVTGTVQVHGKTAYVSQSAWIQTGTIQENILFGSKMDTQRYKDALEKCALLKDIEMLPFGDLTVIGERGVNLSGGQKQRIQLARALYQDADVYLLDDPFSAVDAHTATRLFNDYVMEALSGKTVVLVTHQVDFLPAFNSVLLMHEGRIIASGTYITLMASSPEFQNLVNAHKDSVEPRTLKEEGSLMTEKRSTNGIQRACIEDQTQQQLVGDQLIQQEERETGDTRVKPYMKYLSHEKGFICLSLAILVHILFLVGQTAQNYWLAAKVESSSVSKRELILVYSVIGCGLIFFLVIRSVSTYAMSLGASKSMFSTLLGSLFRAPMSFFDSTPLGRILSRVSSDMSIIDQDIAFTISQMLTATIATYFTFGILTIFTWEVLFIIMPMIYLTRLLQQYYFHSAKELMRINGTTRSTVASNLAESISGATTIRAFRKEDEFFSRNMELIDKNASPVFHSFSANEWLIQRLEILCVVVLSFSALALTLIPFKSSSSGFIGMALSYGLSLNISLVISVQSQCVLANMIVSAERLEQYMHIPSEAPEVIDANRPAPNWPSLGKVSISNLMVRYRPNSPLVLKGITCDFEGGSKIGIVGRTGSGKTTLISALFRLVEPSEGKITIDGIDISTIGLHDLRSHLGIIPQDPTLFYGSVRYNLDPLAEHTDQEIWEVLDKCQLGDTVQGKEGGLDSTVVQDGSNWSMGQRQLFCLGRALLKRRKVLVLDEATASIDNHTDAILQRTIRKEFGNCTVITVAHRIPTVMDSTKILAISDGKLAEFDEPTKLINKEDSLFGQLVREYQSHADNAGMTIEDGL